MSDTTFHAKVEIGRSRFISLEHGTREITLCVMDSARLDLTMSHYLTPAQARALGEDLVRRADAIEGKP